MEAQDPQVVWAARMGMIASVCFLLQYLPQAWLNFQRKSIKGFSTTGIIIKLVGACFLLINAWFTGEAYPVVAYGLFNVLQHSIFMVQFWLYSEDRTNAQTFLLWLFFPIVPTLLYFAVPQLTVLTNFVKPTAQVLSHIPQLRECYRLRTTSGVSMLSQHLNFVGGCLGLYMLFVIPPVAYTTYLLYINSVLQAVSLYALWLVYDSQMVSIGKAGNEHRCT